MQPPDSLIIPGAGRPDGQRGAVDQQRIGPAGPAILRARSPLRGQLLAVVVEDRRVTGLVTTEELRLALLRARLRTSQPAGKGW